MPRILLIEDNPADVYLIQEVLSRQKGTSYEIETAADGDEALRILDTSRVPDLVILDLNLPKASGATLVRAIRENPKFAETLVVTWTSSIKPSETAEYLEMGADRHIVKPLQWDDYEQIGTVLREMMENKRKM